MLNKEVAKKHLLSNREIEVLEDLITYGGSYDEISKRLFISPRTLKNHMSKIMLKLNADNRTAIIPISIKIGIITID
ncbi:response regulator transcription factor [Alkalihalobacillus sp. BA299]|uniref:response regulator transcription factor n=1 Tax=Alkalihalobacillus sp. BA299 TaxID=2815938 RepID=UPI001ADAFA04|nr:helix-turn-helix transcriptional regulator [Alkalihalobacillus sp. BA299]